MCLVCFVCLQQEVLIKQLQEQHYQQYMQRVYQQQLLHQQQQYQQLQAIANITQLTDLPATSAMATIEGRQNQQVGILPSPADDATIASVIPNDNQIMQHIQTGTVNGGTNPLDIDILNDDHLNNSDHNHDDDEENDEENDEDSSEYISFASFPQNIMIFVCKISYWDKKRNKYYVKKVINANFGMH